MKFVTTINPTIEEWKNKDEKVTKDAVIAYAKLLKLNDLNRKNYHPVLGWTYENDDFIKNRITLIIEAKSNSQVINNDNFKDILILRDSKSQIT